MNNTPSTTSSARDFDYGDTRRRTDYVSVCACHLYDADMLTARHPAIRDGDPEGDMTTSMRELIAAGRVDLPAFGEFIYGTFTGQVCGKGIRACLRRGSTHARRLLLPVEVPLRDS